MARSRKKRRTAKEEAAWQEYLRIQIPLPGCEWLFPEFVRPEPPKAVEQSKNQETQRRSA